MITESRYFTAPKSGAVVIIHHCNRLDHLKRALACWEQQTEEIAVIVVDMDEKRRCIDELRKMSFRMTFRVIHVPERWNPNRARNIGAQAADRWPVPGVDYLIFSPADVLVDPEFVARLKGMDTLFSYAVCDGRRSNTPYDPSLDGLIVVSSWINDYVRGFNEGLATRPHGWGGLSEDYLLRLEQCVQRLGVTVNSYTSDMASAIAHNDKLRVAEFEEKDMQSSLAHHRRVSQWYRNKHGPQANLGMDWGDCGL